MKIGTETGSFVNHLYSRMVEGEPAPYVGMPATMLSWTDRSPATVIEVNMLARYIVVQEDDWMRIDSNGMSESQEYRYTPNALGSKTIFRKNKKGQWIQCYRNPETGRLVQSPGPGLRLGKKERYHDFSF